VAEFQDLVAKLLQEQVEEVRATVTNPELEQVQSRLRAQLVNEGGPLIARLKAIGSSDDFRTVSLMQQRLDLAQLQASGVSSDLVGNLETQLRQFSGLYRGTLNSLETVIPRRIAALTPEDILPLPYPTPSFADCIARDITCASDNVNEVESRLEGLKRLVARLMTLPRQSVEVVSIRRPDDIRNSACNPFAQVTAE
jgi:hypothetical protein